ncbi:MBL fold metallo-hydrolase [Nocardia sp. NPDC052566]|uniref:MBL fold metallo-hydrolase n=1 Tax=Nocardia sp. NPDC052566 TaxID=3364330 RepID=UPI0037C7D598
MSFDIARLAQSAALRTFTVGAHQCTWLPDGAATLDPRTWLPASTEQTWHENPHLLTPDGELVASIGALLIRHHGRAMLIDAGAGPLALPTPHGSMHGGQLLESLSAAGQTPTDIDLIALTHLHLDHIGWLWTTPPNSTRRPFTHATVLIGETEWQQRDLAAADGVASEILETFADQIRTFAPGTEIFPGVRAIALLGHSIGHTGYIIGTPTDRLIVFGDAMQTPLQITHPHLTAAIDDAPDLTQITAARLLTELQRPGTRGFGAHFADAQLGRVHTVDGTRTWQPQ